MGAEDLLALIRTCKDSPDDDAPRLVLADWLEEHGDPPRAELIRLQCCGDSADSQLRQDELLSENLARWARPLAQTRYGVAASRGFFHLSNDCDLSYVASQLTREETAWVEGLGFVYQPYAGRNRLGDLAARHPLIGEVVSLSLIAVDVPDAAGTAADSLDGRDVRDLLALAAPRSLRKLHLTRHALSASDAEALLGAPWLGQITSLQVREGDAPFLAAAVASCRPLAGLRELDLSDDRLGDDGLIALSRSEHLKGLNHLDLSGNHCGDEGVTALARSAAARGLRSLNLGRCRLTDAGLRTLARSRALQALEHLELGTVANAPEQITDAGLIALAESPHLKNLRTLTVRAAGATDRAASALAASPHLRSLQQLTLYDTQIGDAGAQSLLEPEGLPELREVSLPYCATARGRTADEQNALRARLAERGRVRVEV